MYICKVISNTTTERTYSVSTRSAYKAAQEYGRGEGGEIVTITTKSGREISRAQWSSERREYYRATL